MPNTVPGNIKATLGGADDEEDDTEAGVGEGGVDKADAHTAI